MERLAAYKKKAIAEGRFDKTPLPSHARLIIDSVGSVGNLGFAINHLYFLGDKCEKVTIDISEGKKIKMGYAGQNPYDNILNQSGGVPVDCFGNELFDYDSEILADVRAKVKKYFHFKNYVNNLGITGKTLGVHIRMNDMNAWHGDQFGYVYFEDYIKAIESLTGWENMFVASDNFESLEKLIKIYGDRVIYHPEMNRAENEHEPGTEDELREKGFEKLRGKFNFESPFLDLFGLMKCGYIIGRKYSNFTTAAVFLGVAPFENIINL